MELKLISSPPAKFTLEEADSCLGLIRKWTIESQKEIELWTSRKLATEASGPDSDLFDSSIREVLNRWQSRVKQLGAIPRGLWTVDFDHGNGYYCWRFPEERIAFQHSYEHGNTGRKPLSKETMVRSPTCESH